MLGNPAGFWGKLRTQAGIVEGWHPLEAHCADVAACCKMLLERTILGQRLAVFGGLRRLDPGTVEKLSLLAALHDLGKFNMGFQNKALPDPGFVAGHTHEVYRCLTDASRPQLAVSIATGLQWEMLATWCGNDERTAAWLKSTFGHHGGPISDGAGSTDKRIWQDSGRLRPLESLAGFVKLAISWLPGAASGGGQLPDSPEMRRAFSGLVMLADWVGSDTRFFPFWDKPLDGYFEVACHRAARAVEGIGLDIHQARHQFSQKALSFDVVSPFSPRPMQSLVAQLPADLSSTLGILESETGSGKTEAALFHFARLFHAGLVDGMYFALPTRSSATQIHGRVLEVIQRMFPDESVRPPVVLAVPGYLSVDGASGTRLAPFEVLWPDDEFQRMRHRGWAAEHPKRYLAGAIVVGTVDQVLVSSLQVNHSRMRAAAVSRLLLVVDEVHASDSYMGRLLEEVLRRHMRCGGHAFLMSATLASDLRNRLLSVRSSGREPPQDFAGAVAAKYPSITMARDAGSEPAVFVPPAPALPSSEKSVRFQLESTQTSPTEVSMRALTAANEGARVIVLRNTVQDAIATQVALEQLAEARGQQSLLFQCAGRAALHHSRFCKEDREALDHSIEAEYGKQSGGRRNLGLVAVATQTIQQSLDLDADLLITDLCPIDVLLQRVGRLHRHQRARPQAYVQALCVVLVPEGGTLSPMVQADGKVRGRHGYGSVYPDLRILELTWRVIAQNGQIRIPEMNRFLVESVLHPSRLKALALEPQSPWEKHAHQVFGALLADRQLAALNLDDWRRADDQWEGGFGSKELQRRISTRLGEEDRLAQFSPPVFGPFGNAVDVLRIPHFLARDIGPDAEPGNIKLCSEGFEFDMGDNGYRYDRFGLQQRAVKIEEDPDE